MRNTDINKMTVPELKMRLNKINKEFSVNKTIEQLQQLQEDYAKVSALLNQKASSYEQQLLSNAMDKYIKDNDKVTLNGFMDLLRKDNPFEYAINYMNIVPRLKQHNLLDTLEKARVKVEDDTEQKILKEAVSKYIKENKDVKFTGFVKFMKDRYSKKVDFSIHYPTVVTKLKAYNLLDEINSKKEIVTIEKRKKSLEEKIQELQKQLQTM